MRTGPLLAQAALLLALVGGGTSALAHGLEGRALAPAFAVAAAPASAAPAAHADEERIVEGRLLAPCCYVQTLDIHESPMATELRLEVRTRLAAGEPAAAIEDDFVARYGERVRALPKGQDPRRGMVYLSAAVLFAGAVALAAMLRRWRRASNEGPGEPGPAALPGAGAPLAGLAAAGAPHDALDDRIDEDLRAMDG